MSIKIIRLSTYDEVSKDVFAGRGPILQLWRIGVSGWRRTCYKHKSEKVD
jgi:hypothetical protein